jgi:hypothetical protein
VKCLSIVYFIERERKVIKLDRYEVVPADDKFIIWDNKANDIYEYSCKYDTEEEAFKRAEKLNEGSYGFWRKFD